MKRISELGTLAVSSNHNTMQSSWLIRFSLMMGAIRSSESSILKRTTRRQIPEDDILQIYTCTRKQMALSSVLANGFLQACFVSFLYSRTEMEGQ
jgi:hypothetical protein